MREVLERAEDDVAAGAARVLLVTGAGQDLRLGDDVLTKVVPDGELDAGQPIPTTSVTWRWP
ncbi:hypothetical protein ACFV0T_18690 [Streptomyces sp. NPDC059582]|uniref:hypothetical protein n=1 Tax=Streptomyces sp. NPDC059582 TaxID=3346875 RepID=UPI0036B86010